MNFSTAQRALALARGLLVMALFRVSAVHLIMFCHVICCATRVQYFNSMLLSNALVHVCVRPTWELKVLVVGRVETAWSPWCLQVVAFPSRPASSISVLPLELHSKSIRGVCSCASFAESCVVSGVAQGCLCYTCGFAGSGEVRRGAR